MAGSSGGTERTSAGGRKVEVEPAGAGRLRRSTRFGGLTGKEHDRNENQHKNRETKDNDERPCTSIFQDGGPFDKSVRCRIMPNQPPSSTHVCCGAIVVGS